jgi:AcrR family transcriptional regulator
VAAWELLCCTVFDAAHHELAARDWSEVTMADFAVAAGVSRQMLYKHFGSRDEFALALLLREADRFIEAVEGVMDDHLDDPEAALLAGVELFLTGAAEDHLVRAAITGRDATLPPARIHGQALLERSTERLHLAIGSRWAQLAGQDGALLVECLIRLAISYAALPADPAAVAGASIATLLGPYVEQVLGAKSRSVGSRPSRNRR